MLGWTSTGASYGYAQQPAATVTDPEGKPAAGDDAPELIFHGTWRELATPVFAEVYDVPDPGGDPGQFAIMDRQPAPVIPEGQRPGRGDYGQDLDYDYEEENE